MKKIGKRTLCLALCLALALSLLGPLTVWAEPTIWIEEPTGWVNWGHVDYRTETAEGKTYVLNWGVRGERAVFLTEYALDYYAAEDWAYALMAEQAGGTGVEDVLDSPLYAALRSFLIGKQTFQTTYNGTRGLFRYTDCMVSNAAYISSFYSGIRLNGAWDSGATWNREHTWPNSKGYDNQDNDIMMLRPTSVSENSSRGNKAYGESPGFYHPNAEANGRFDLRGDCARIMLYCYVRWNNQSYMWGAQGVMESLDVMLTWMEEDPVDTWEMGRNDAVQSITGVRNCFVDYPELAWALFGRAIPAAVYPTPSAEGPEGPAANTPIRLTARSRDENQGTVSLRGWAVDCTAAPGYYVSGFDLLTSDGSPVPETAPWSLFRWENGRLLFFPQGAADYLVEIHFTPLGQTDPCPAGHAWGEGVETAASCTEAGEIVYLCSRCGLRRTEAEAEPYGHAWVYYKERGYWQPVLTCYCGEVFDCYEDWLAHAEASLDLDWLDQHAGYEFHEDWRIKPAHYGCVHCGQVWREAGDPPAAEAPFLDVAPLDDWFVPVQWAYHHQPEQVTAGVDETHFGPAVTVTRAQAMVFFWAAKGKPQPAAAASPFKDVKPKHWYYNAVLWAVDYGITAGTDETHFSPNKTCTRSEIVQFLYAAMDKPDYTIANPYSDVKNKHWYKDAAIWAFENGIECGSVSGAAIKFKAATPCTRASVVTYLYRFLMHDLLAQ